MRLKEKAWRVYCRCRTFASVTIEDLRKGKLKGHLVEVIVILTLFITLAFVFFRPDTSTRKISFYFKDIQIEAKYHREQILKIQKEKESLNHLEQFHSTAYGKILSEFEDALSKDISHGIPKQVLLQEICRDNLHDLQGQYFASEGSHFDMEGPLSKQVRTKISKSLGKLLLETKGSRSGMKSCALFDVGSSSNKSSEILIKVLDEFEPYTCDTYVYETTTPNVESLEGALERSNHARRVRLKGFWNYTMDGKSAPFSVSTLDTVMKEQLQREEYLPSDVIVARIGRMVDDSFWKEIYGGADTIERIAGRRINLSPLQGLEQFLLTKRLTAVVWESYTDEKLKEEVSYVSSFGYSVYIVGSPKFVRIDRYYWDDKYSGSSKSNQLFGMSEESVGTCHFSITLIAVVEEHTMNSQIQNNQLPCKHVKGISCKCDNFQTTSVYDMC